MTRILATICKSYKGGIEFAKTGVRHLVNVSQGMMGARWPREEWDPNMAKLEVSIVLDERKSSNQERIDGTQRPVRSLGFPITGQK